MIGMRSGPENPPTEERQDELKHKPHCVVYNPKDFTKHKFKGIIFKNFKTVITEC